MFHGHPHQQSQNELIDCPICRTQLVCPPNSPIITCGVCKNPIRVDRSRHASFNNTATAGQSSLPSQYRPQAPTHVQLMPVPPSHGAPPLSSPPWNCQRRRALLVGINYAGTSAQLGGCINDVRCMEYLLKTKFFFMESNILMLTEENPNPIMRPTRANIINGMIWLTSGCQPGDSLFFHYSGHGTQVPDFSGDELNGLSETILPLDYRQQGPIIDDTINEILVNPLPPGCRLHAVIDACHSGSGTDGYGRANWLFEAAFARKFKGTQGGEAVCFSACDDSQVAADTSHFSKVTSTGAMTFLFIEAIETGHGMTYASILNQMNRRLREANASTSMSDPLGFGGSTIVTDLLGMIISGGSYGPRRGALHQVPQLSSSHPFDVNRPFMI